MSIKLTTGDRIAETSSKGNQEKWREKGRWYKLDLFGYEGLAGWRSTGGSATAVPAPTFCGPARAS